MNVYLWYLVTSSSGHACTGAEENRGLSRLNSATGRNCGWCRGRTTNWHHSACRGDYLNWIEHKGVRLRLRIWQARVSGEKFALILWLKTGKKVETFREWGCRYESTPFDTYCWWIITNVYPFQEKQNFYILASPQTTYNLCNSKTVAFSLLLCHHYEKIRGLNCIYIYWAKEACATIA